MCKTISFLSGKGGSGKTTLALSMASLLSRCGIKVLLVDCDLSTNGATYFYEDRITTRKRLTSFYDIIFDSCGNKSNVAQIDEFYDFIPSITQITQKITKVYSHKNENKFAAYSELIKKYDVILLDCQAGYTDVLKYVLPYVDINLFVMEADAISSAAMRSLYLKIGDIINEKKNFQVFNKASKEEYETYSRVSGGTVFTNIETIVFDWKIRKAFAVSQIPDMENTSANFGEQIWGICSILFPKDHYQEKLKVFKSILQEHRYKEEQQKIKKRISELKDGHRNEKSSLSKNLVLATLLVCSVVLFGCVVVNTDFTYTSHEMMLPIIVFLITIIMTLLNILEMIRGKNNSMSSIREYMKQLEEVDKLRAELVKQRNSEGKQKKNK